MLNAKYPPVKSLYNQDYKLTPEACRIDMEVTMAVQPIFDKWIKEGYSPRELNQVMSSAIDMIMLMEIL